MSRQNILLSVDAVVFGYDPEPRISVLLIRRKYPPFQGDWALPGGFVHNQEKLETAVERELREETGLTINYLEQLYTFGKPDRDPRAHVVSVTYYGLVRPGAHTISASTDAEAVQWFDIHDLPPLAFDHSTILQVAIQRLRGKITYEPVGFELLDEKFPFSDLENLYSTLLGREIDRRNFRKKILSLDVLEELNEKQSRGAGRPATLFRFNKEKYFQLKAKGIVFEI
jgi:8-oxo-dGTP diphosphatase